METQGWPCRASTGARHFGGPASARGCHGDWRAGGGGCEEKRSALSLAATPGPGGAGESAGLASASPVGGPGHGVPQPEPLGGRTGLGAAHRSPALTAAACPALGGAEAARGPRSTFRMLIKEYHILLPMSLDEYQVAQLYMIQVSTVGRTIRGAILHDVVTAGVRRPHRTAPWTRV